MKTIILIITIYLFQGCANHHNQPDYLQAYFNELCRIVGGSMQSDHNQPNHPSSVCIGGHHAQ